MNSFDETEQKLRELIAKAVKSRTPNVVVSTAELGALMFEMELWRKEYCVLMRLFQNLRSDALARQ